MTHLRSTGRRLATVAAAAGLAVLALALPASAHVTVNPNVATQGSYAKLTFRVPTESDSASTKKLQVFFPKAEPLASVSVKPHPGWSFKVTTIKLATPITSDDGTITDAVSEIAWTADSAATQIKPGEFDEFDISVGPLPKASSMEFKALQTYSDGSVVRWIESATPGSATPPAHPAPVLTLTPASDTTGGAAAATPASSGNGRATTALVLSIVALVVAVGGLGAGALKRSRS